MNPCSKKTNFLTGAEILSRAKDHRFLRWARDAYAEGRLRIRCASIQERRDILLLLLGPLSHHS